MLNLHLLQKLVFHFVRLVMDSPAKFPVSQNLWNKQNDDARWHFTRLGSTIGTQRPTLQIPPIKAGIRAREWRNLAFPCKEIHSGCSNSLPMKAFSYRCGDSARLASASRLTPMLSASEHLNASIIRHQVMRTQKHQPLNVISRDAWSGAMNYLRLWNECFFWNIAIATRCATKPATK